MKLYTYRHQLWLYKQDRLWPRIKKELKIFTIIFLWIATLAVIASLTAK